METASFFVIMIIILFSFSFLSISGMTQRALQSVADATANKAEDADFPHLCEGIISYLYQNFIDFIYVIDFMLILSL